MQSPGISIRGFLIAEVGRFVARARVIPGVRRIALIGSLTTVKQDPKDADVLIWLDDEADLARLATVGRQLMGAAQGRNRNADVFLADRDDNYLGRVCPYRDCRPGIRMSCQAPHCGRRSHLCDDLQRLTLPTRVLKSPPLELWPTIVRRGTLPEDLEALTLPQTAVG